MWAGWSASTSAVSEPATRLLAPTAAVSSAGAAGGAADSYWDTVVSGATTSATGTGQTTAELTAPSGYSGIYENWNVRHRTATDTPTTPGGSPPRATGTRCCANSPPRKPPASAGTILLTAEADPRRGRRRRPGARVDLAARLGQDLAGVRLRHERLHHHPCPPTWPRSASSAASPRPIEGRLRLPGRRRRPGRLRGDRRADRQRVPARPALGQCRRRLRGDPRQRRVPDRAGRASTSGSPTRPTRPRSPTTPSARPYTLTITRAQYPAADTALRYLAVSPGSINFDPDTRRYRLDVASTVNSITVTPRTSSPYAIVTVAGEDPDIPVALKPGENPHRRRRHRRGRRDHQHLPGHGQPRPRDQDPLHRRRRHHRRKHRRHADHRHRPA